MESGASSTLLRASRFFVKHGIATAMVAVVCIVLTVAVYCALLLGAIVTDGGLGGPLALPGMVIMAAIVALLASVVVFMPVTVATEMLCARVRRFRWLVEIAVATAGLVTYATAIVLAAGFRRNAELRELLTATAVVNGVFLVLLGIYWWSSRAAQVVLALLPKAVRWVRHAIGAA